MCLAPVAHAQTLSKDQCVDANEAAQSLKRDGALSEARAKLQLCMQPECPGPVRADCTELLAAVEAAMPTISFDVRDARGVHVENVKVTIDGKPLNERLDATPIVVDPGSHWFEFSAFGQPHTSLSVELKAGQKRQERVDLIDKNGPLLKGLGIGAIATGGVIAALGAYWGVRAKSTYDDAKKHCPNGSSSCDVEGILGGEKAHDQAARSTIAFVVGGVFVAGGATMYWFGQRMTIAPTTTGRADGGLVVSGVW
jgi:hypothetical protein